jgi:hypothetical protein
MYQIYVVEGTVRLRPLSMCGNASTHDTLISLQTFNEKGDSLLSRYRIMKTTSARGMMAGRQPTDMPAASLFEISGNGNNYIGSARGLHAFEQSQCSVSVHGIHTHVKISQLVNKMCSQQACSEVVNELSQSCYFIKLLQGCHSQLVDKLLNCRTITSCWNNL